MDRRRFLAATAAVAILVSVDGSDEPDGISADRAAEVVNDHVYPAAHILSGKDTDPAEAIPELEQALAKLRDAER